jgi:hypothetical protein
MVELGELVARSDATMAQTRWVVLGIRPRHTHTHTHTHTHASISRLVLGDTSFHAIRSNKDGFPGVQQGISDLQRRASLLLHTGGPRGGDQALQRARSFLPAEPLEGMSRLAYTLEQKVRGKEE